MRAFPGTYSRLAAPKGLPLRVKGGPAAKVVHLSPPLKGLSRFAQLSESDPMLASILTNWIVEEDRISIRPGRKTLVMFTPAAPISALVPYYGSPSTLAVAFGNKLYNFDGTLLASGFSSDDWHWTSFTNLSDIDFTILVNGVDGVRSWDGTVVVSEAVTAPSGETWILPAKFDKTLAHMNRLWFADSVNLAVYYLPLQQKTGEVAFLPLNAIFKRGGSIVAIATWTMDGGMGTDDKLVIFTSNGEAAIYGGTDPDVDFSLVGVFFFDAPMSKHSIVKYGGDLYVLIGTGLVPMSKLLQAETEQLGKSDQNVFSEFKDLTRLQRTVFGWSAILDHHHNLVICNLPQGGGKYVQMVRRMPAQVWVKLTDIPARCWGWINDELYIGTDDGKLCHVSKEYLSDDGAPINADVRWAWSSFKSLGVKHFKMVRLYAITDGVPRPYVDVEVDYQNTTPLNRPEATEGDPDAIWDFATWDVNYWATTPTQMQSWQGVANIGRVGAPRIRVSVVDCRYALTGLDVIYETGSVM